jgi:hypothetical protein
MRTVRAERARAEAVLAPVDAGRLRDGDLPVVSR